MTTIAQLLGGIDVLLLDFDGPVCSVFAGYPAPHVADDLRADLVAKGLTGDVSLTEMTDPLDVLRWVATVYPNMSREIDEVMRTAERKAVQTASPTPYAHEVILTAESTGRAVAIVSNNSAEAISDYLSIHQLVSHVAFVAGRARGAPELMKPHPDSVERAVRHLEVAPASCAFVGDSVTDIEVANLTGVLPIGYANSAARKDALTKAGALVAIETMYDLIRELR